MTQVRKSRRLLPASSASGARSADFSENHATARAVHILHEAERRAEWLLAWMRAAAFVLLVFGLRVFEFAQHSDFFLISLVVYGAATIGAIVLAWHRFHHQLCAWILATLDVGLILACISMSLARLAGEPSPLFAHPAAAMIFLLLAHGAVRYRPAILAYSFALFVIGWATILLSATGAAPISADGQRGAIIGVTVLALTTLALWISSRRARMLILRVVDEVRLRELLACYVADPVVRGLDRPTVRRQEVAILFADMRGFTAIAENRDPTEVVGFLESYREICERAISRHGGILDKFIGDAVMAVFQGPSGSVSAARCVAAALELHGEIATWNSERQCRGEPRIEVGIGAHLGDAIAGTIGRNGRLEYTVIGDAVNSAQRIERLTSKLGRPLLVSAELIEAAGPEFRSYFGLLGLHTLDGRQQPKLLFGLADRGDRKRESSALFMRTAPTGS